MGEDSETEPPKDGASADEFTPLLGDRDDEATAQVGSVQDIQRHGIPASRRIGVAGAVSLILNKMIGTGSKIFAMPADSPGIHPTI